MSQKAKVDIDVAHSMLPFCSQIPQKNAFDFVTYFEPLVIEGNKKASRTVLVSGSFKLYFILKLQDIVQIVTAAGRLLVSLSHCSFYFKFGSFRCSVSTTRYCDWSSTVHLLPCWNLIGAMPSDQSSTQLTSCLAYNQFH